MNVKDEKDLNQKVA